MTHMHVSVLRPDETWKRSCFDIDNGTTTIKQDGNMVDEMSLTHALRSLKPHEAKSQSSLVV